MRRDLGEIFLDRLVCRDTRKENEERETAHEGRRRSEPRIEYENDVRKQVIYQNR
jgi:hypothetical protein